MTSPAIPLKNQISGQREKIALAHRSGASGFETCVALTVAMDDAIRSACGALVSEARPHIAVLALGGYGRVELCPHSDVDVMILCESGEWRDRAGAAAKEFLHVLWDAGVDVGHSVRTIEEALEQRGKSIDSWAAMLESRYICGNNHLADRFFESLRKTAAGGTDRWLIEGILAETGNRHGRYGNSVKLLEPNIKKSSGGLRDLQSVFWLFRFGSAPFSSPLGPQVPALKVFLDLLHREGSIGKEERTDALAALQFLLRARHEMHYQRESLHDTLEYGLQLPVADGLGFGPTNGTSAVEVFMRQYYRHARTVNRLCGRFGRQFRELVEPVSHGDAEEEIGEVFVLANDTISVKPDLQRFTAVRQIFEAFMYAAENDAELDFRLHGVIERSIDLLTPEQSSSADLAAMFRRILNSRRVAYTLRMMNELGVLGRFIPEFGELVAFFQHNVYHYFTADEHTLIAINNAESLREQSGVLHEVFRNLSRKEVLYCAILLHDIAKPRGVAEHEITGVEMARAILHRLGMDDIFPPVAFLIRHHLVMEQIAFRRDIHDPGTIKEFASRFERPEQLDQLLLLTYADLSAVNINVWTEWKATMLRDLYLHASEILHRNLRGAQVDRFHQSKREAAVSDVVNRLSMTLPREHVEQHMFGIQSEAYVSLFTDREIEQHIKKGMADEQVSTLFKQSEGYTDVTLIGRDAPFALSRFCAVLSANDANIFDANIFTRDDGVIIDRFRVSDAASGKHLDQRVCTKITEDLRLVMKDSLDVDHLFGAHKRKWKRKQKRPLNPNIRIDVEFEDNPRFTIVDVYAPDSVGFLYRVTETISRLGLNIHFAKIATRMDGVVDAFYVLDETGKPVTEPTRRESIKQEILGTIKTLLEEQLT